MLDADLLRALTLAASLLGLGLVAGTSPTLYALVLRLLGRDRGTRPPVTVLVAGYGVGTTVLALLLQVVDPRSVEVLLRGRVERAVVDRGVDLVAGLLLLTLGVVVLHRARTRSRRSPRPPSERPRTLFLTGFLDAIVSVGSIAPIYVTARTVRAASPDDLLRLAAYAVFLVALLGPYLLVAWAWDRLPGVASRARAVMARVGAVDPRPAAAAALVVAGLVFLVLALWVDDGGLLGAGVPVHADDMSSP